MNDHIRIAREVNRKLNRSILWIGKAGDINIEELKKRMNTLKSIDQEYAKKELSNE